MTLNPSQIAGYARQAGFRGNDLSTAVAVAMAESTGNPDKHNATPPDDSYGLWQINMLGSMGPERRKEFGIRQDSDLLDPATNAHAAKKVYDEKGSFEPWTTYKNGAYRRYLDQARQAVQHPSGGGGGASTGGAHKASAGTHDGGKHAPAGNTVESLIGDHKGGFAVDPDRLDAYAKTAHRIGDSVHHLARTQTPPIAEAAKGFGQVGNKTGLEAAVSELANAVDYEMKNVAWRVSRLASATENVAKQYRAREQRTKHHLTRAAEK